VINSRLTYGVLNKGM